MQARVCSEPSGTRENGMGRGHEGKRTGKRVRRILEGPHTRLVNHLTDHVCLKILYLVNHRSRQQGGPVIGEHGSQVSRGFPS